mgnify:CR=1 FL=1
MAQIYRLYTAQIGRGEPEEDVQRWDTSDMKGIRSVYSSVQEEA